ncbi:helix-turn-helix domain-containing protein [Aureimonas mangrovi]
MQSEGVSVATIAATFRCSGMQVYRVLPTK